VPKEHPLSEQGASFVENFTITINSLFAHSEEEEEVHIFLRGKEEL
tara:strand:- start:393 stop:530 length:138 start_codon:yes stop_codon:yes gene_type:complete